MSPSLETRKPIDQLQPDDLVAFPIWEFALDEEGNEEQDETWVRPVAGKFIGPDLYSLSVAADFQTASGQTITGLVGVSTADGFEFEHGALLHRGRYIFVPSEEFPDAKKEHMVVASALGMRESEVFPLKFSLRALVQGEETLRHGVFG